MRRLALPLLVLLVLGGTAAALGITESRKLTKSPVRPDAWTVRALAPTCGCPFETIELPVAFRQRERVTARVVTLDGAVVRTLVERLAVRRGSTTFTWDGRSTDGSVAADGGYRLELVLARADRTILIPARFRVDTRPPVPPDLLRPRAPVELTPDGDGRANRVWVRIRSHERASAVLELDGDVVRRSAPHPRGRFAIDWSGRMGSEPLPDGTYRLRVRLVDPLGNRSDAVPVPPIELRAGRR